MFREGEGVKGWREPKKGSGCGVRAGTVEEVENREEPFAEGVPEGSLEGILGDEKAGIQNQPSFFFLFFWFKRTFLNPLGEKG